MHQAIDPGLDFDEHAEVGDRLDLALHVRADRMLLGERLPWIRFGLLESERDAPVALVNAEHLHLDRVVRH